MNNDHGHVCPVTRAGSLDNILRRWLQNPLKILSPYIHEGMTVLDVGCGPGFFTIPMAQLVGGTGRVIAVDLQEGMLDKVRRKITGTEIEKRVVLHRCDKDRIGISERADFILLFYMAHEISEKGSFFNEIARIIKLPGLVLLVEPPFHVSKSAFKGTLGKAEAAGFTQFQGPKVFLSKTAILQKGQHLLQASA